MAVSSNMLRSAFVQLTRIVSRQCIQSVSRPNCVLSIRRLSYVNLCRPSEKLDNIDVRRLSTSSKSDSTSMVTPVSELIHPEDWTIMENPALATDILSKVEAKLASEDVGRLFAVVHVSGKQHKITTEDIIVVEHNFPPTVGDKIRLEKVLMLGGKDFSLVGQPLLSRDQVYVDATVVEKTLSHYKTIFKFIKRKRHTTFKLERYQQTMLVINNIHVLKPTL